MLSEPDTLNNDRETTSKAFRVFLQGAEDVLGNRGMATVLHMAKLSQYISNLPPSTGERAGHKVRFITRVAHTICQVYGARGSRAILQRVGRSQARAGVVENQTVVNLTKAAMKLGPQHQQVRVVLEMAARAVREQIGDEVRVTEEDGQLYYDAHTCCYCMDWHSDAPVCHASIGFLDGLLHEMFGQDGIKVEETLCRAKGDAMCRYRVTVQE